MNQEYHNDIFEVILKNAVTEVAEQEIKNLPTEIDLIPKVHLSEDFECNMKTVIKTRKKIMQRHRRIIFIKRFFVFTFFLLGILLIKAIL